jgi:hypothetical protein
MIFDFNFLIMINQKGSFMKKLMVAVGLITFVVYGADNQRVGRPASLSKESSKANMEVSFNPALIYITAIVNQAHNPISVMNALARTGEIVSFTIPADKSSADADVCEYTLNIPIEYCDAEKNDQSADLRKFHLSTGHGLYTFVNTKRTVAGRKLNKKGQKESREIGLLKPWAEERSVELVYGHDGKLQMRLPGSLISHVQSKKSKKLKKQ